MGRVLTNNVSLSYSIETSLGVAGTTWFLIEPNEISTFGAVVTTVAREPISKNRQRRKGTVTDLDSSVEYDEDLTMSSFRHFIEGFCFATGINSDMTDLAATACETTGDSYTGMTAFSSDQADKLEVDTLLWVTGGATAANNGLKSVDADIASSGTAITVTENLVDETASFNISLAGHRMAALDAPTWTWDSPATDQATLALTGIGTELQALGVIAGMTLHIGSIAAAGDTTVTNAFENSVADDMFGYCRVVSFPDADSVVFDKVDAALQFTDAAISTAVDILFGEFIRNVAVDDAAYLERSFQFEAEFPNLGAGATDEFQYALGNFCNSVTFELPLTDKATCSFGFIGTDTENPVASGSRKTGASAASNPLHTAAFNTTSDIARLRITDTDETGLTTDFKSISLTLSNNVSPEKIIGTLGAAYMNTGNFETELEAQLLFTNGDVVDRIRANTTVTMDFVIKNDDGVISVDFPSMDLGAGDREFPVNESVLINTTGMSFQDATLDTSIGISIFPVPLP